MSDKFKQKKWSVNSALNRQVKIKDGAFDTVTTKQKTKYMNFDKIYYISDPISEDEFAGKVGLWRTQRQLEDNELMDENAYYKDECEASTTCNDDDVIWVLRRESTVTTGTPKTLCVRETVLQRKWQAKGRPRIPLPIIQESPDLPDNWYTEPDDVYSIEATGNDRVTTETYYTEHGVHDGSYMNFNENDTVNGSSLVDDVQTCWDIVYEDEQTLLHTLADEETQPKFEDTNEYFNRHAMPRYNKLPHRLLSSPLNTQTQYTNAISDNGDEHTESGESSSCGSGDTNLATKGSSVEDFDVREVWDREMQEEHIWNDTIEPEYPSEIYCCESLTALTNMCAIPTPSVNVIKKLRMPTLEWSELKSNEDSENEYDETATEVYAPPIPPRIKKSAASNGQMKETKAEIKEGACPEIPPQVYAPPIPPRIKKSAASNGQMKETKAEINEGACPEIPPRMTISRSRHSSENSATQREHRREETVRQFNNSGGTDETVQKCNSCNRGQNITDAHSTDREELNRLQTKGEELTRRNEVSKEKIALRKEINAQLKVELENKRQLHKLEQEEKACEAAIENVGKPADFQQLDEYYGKFLPPPQEQEQTYGSKMRVENVLDFYSQRGKAEIPLGNNPEKGWRRRKIFLKNGRKSFSTKIYAADSGIADE